MSVFSFTFGLEISSANWVLTDSFHALMFSTIFDRNVRILRPRNGRGEAGFARLEEFVLGNYKTNILCNDYHGALNSFSAGVSAMCDKTQLDKKRETSLVWLKTSLHKVEPKGPQ